MPQLAQSPDELSLAVDVSGDAFIFYFDYEYVGQVDLGVVSSLASDFPGNLYFAEESPSVIRELTNGCPAVTQPLLAANGVVNAGSYDFSYQSPGEITAIFWNNLGPASGESVPVISGAFPAGYGGVGVTVNGYPAPLLYVSAGQVNFVVPFETAGQQTRLIQLSYNGVLSDIYYGFEGNADPGVFAIANPDASLNSAATPVTAGSYVVIYGTGQGVSNPAETNGTIMGDVPAIPRLAVTMTIDYQAATLLYAGSAPGLVAGVLQINLPIPAELTPGAHALGMSIGGMVCYQSVFLYTK